MCLSFEIDFLTLTKKKSEKIETLKLFEFQKSVIQNFEII